MWIHRCSLPISMDNLPIFDEVVIMLGNYEHFYMLMNNSGLITIIAKRLDYAQMTTDESEEKFSLKND